MLIDEIAIPDTMDDAARQLYRAKYQNLASEPGHTGGSYSDIMWHPGAPYVVKLFMATDLAYLSYLRLITSVSNPHFPVLRGKPMQMGRGYYGVRLEKLSPLTPAGDNNRYWMEAVLQYLHADNMGSAKNSAANLSQTEKQAVVSIFTRCLRGHPELEPDLHNYNAMMRGDTVVLIDPIRNTDE